MIEESEYRLPKKKQSEPKPKADPETLEYLKNLPWRPFGADW